MLKSLIRVDLVDHVHCLQKALLLQRGLFLRLHALGRLLGHSRDVGVVDERLLLNRHVDLGSWLVNANGVLYVLIFEFRAHCFAQFILADHFFSPQALVLCFGILARLLTRQKHLMSTV